MNVQEFKNDYNWQQAFYTAGQISIDEVNKVIAADPGENDERDWIVIFQAKDGRFGKLFAGCDYTGWD